MTRIGDGYCPHCQRQVELDELLLVAATEERTVAAIAAMLRAEAELWVDNSDRWHAYLNAAERVESGSWKVKP